MAMPPPPPEQCTPRRSRKDTAMVSGFSPSGSRVIQSGDEIGVLRKNLFNYRYIERLEMDNVVGNISGEKEDE